MVLLLLFDLSATMTTAVQQIVNDLLKMIAAVLPITVTLLVLRLAFLMVSALLSALPANRLNCPG